MSEKFNFKSQESEKYNFREPEGVKKYNFRPSEELRMDPREIEPIYNYQFTTDAEDNDLTLEIPGYFKGVPLVKELHYNGGEHGIYVRNAHQMLLCDFIHEGVRELLSQAHDIFLSETDAKQDYMIRVVHDDIDALAEEALRLHDYRFHYHPFPIADGTLTIGEEPCEICGKKKGIYYIDPAGTDDLGVRKKARILCPHCIQENREMLFWNLDGCYRSRAGDKDVYYGGLPFFDKGRDASFWGIHCNHLAIYLGKLEPEDLVPLHDEILSTWKWDVLNPYADMDPAETLGWFDRGGLNAYLFKCKECGKKLLAFSQV
ncbi:MAG: CbrC family protein [Lachnospiraceae bacterium]|nr:CbrC family protein [Lachnospiraceae bacterium]